MSLSVWRVRHDLWPRPAVRPGIGAAGRADAAGACVVGPFPASYPLTDAGDVLLVPTRGHTFGHLSVLVEQPGGPRLVLAGDASYRQDLMLDGVVDGVAADEKAAKATLGRLQRYVREQPTVYLPAHDPGSDKRFSAQEIIPA